MANTIAEHDWCELRADRSNDRARGFATQSERLLAFVSYFGLKFVAFYVGELEGDATMIALDDLSFGYIAVG